MNIKNMNYYEILGVSLNATQKEIRQAYLKKVKKYHPDIYKAEDAEEIIKTINIAYDTLINPATKEQYDQKIYHDTSSYTSQNDEISLEIFRINKNYNTLSNMLNIIIERIDNGDSNLLDLLDIWLRCAYMLDNKLNNLKINDYKIYSIQAHLKEKIIKAEIYKTIDKRILNGCINSGQFILDRLIKIEKIIIKYPQNKKTIKLYNYANDLLQNYINEVKFASNENFNYIDLPLIAKYINQMSLTKSNCEKLLINNYQDILKQKEYLQNQYKTNIEIKDFILLISSSILLTGGIICDINTSNPSFSITLSAFPGYIIINFDILIKIYNKIKHNKEITKNQNKIKKLDGFINELKGKKI